MFQSKSSKQKIDTISKVLNGFRRIAVILLTLYAIGAGIYKGISSGSSSQLWFWSFIGLLAGLFVVAIFIVTELSLSVWEKSMDWTINNLRRNLKLRRWVIFIFTLLFIFVIFYVTIFNWMWDNLLRIPVFIFFGLIIPAALISFVKDDVAREGGRLAEQIPSELVIQNPQAAIEHAFTIFEEYLRKRVGVGSDLIGEKLINHAFAKNGKLVFSEIESENEGVRNFISGTYATFRNPRKHRVVDDNEQTAFAIINLIELLFKIVDESKDREQSPK